MGAGWRLVYTDHPEETGSAEWPAARDNTNNRAEYLALIGALDQYLVAPLLEACKATRALLVAASEEAPQHRVHRGARLLVLVQAAARCPGSRLPRWSAAFVSRPVDLLAGQ